MSKYIHLFRQIDKIKIDIKARGQKKYQVILGDMISYIKRDVDNYVLYLDNKVIGHFEEYKMLKQTAKSCIITDRTTVQGLGIDEDTNFFTLSPYVQDMVIKKADAYDRRAN